MECPVRVCVWGGDCKAWRLLVTFFGIVLVEEDRNCLREVASAWQGQVCIVLKPIKKE